MPQYSKAKSASTSFNSLVISKKNKKQLTKNQDAFNKLTHRIEKLQNEIVKKEKQFDIAIKMYGEELHPSKMNVIVKREELVVLLWGIYKEKRLARYDQQNLKQMVRDHLQGLMMELSDEPSDVIKLIFNELEGEQYDKMLEQEKEAAKANMIKQLKKMHVDISDIDSDDENMLAQKLQEAARKMYEAQQEKINTSHHKKQFKKKSVQQIEAEKLQQEVDTLKQKNIGTIYKQLAKLFHPDLEQDEERKMEKAILMQELTAAYEAKNLHALLRLEMKWIHKESSHLESLAEEKLAIYVEILKEQVFELQHQKEGIINQPQYRVLAENFGWEIQRYPVETVRTNVTYFEELLASFKTHIEDLKSEYALRYTKQMIKQWKILQDEMDEDPF